MTALSVEILRAIAQGCAMRSPTLWQAEVDEWLAGPADPSGVFYRFLRQRGATSGAPRGWLARAETRLFWMTGLHGGATEADLRRVMVALNHNDHRCPLVWFGPECGCCGEDVVDGDWLGHFDLGLAKRLGLVGDAEGAGT